MSKILKKKWHRLYVPGLLIILALGSVLAGCGSNPQPAQTATGSSGSSKSSSSGNASGSSSSTGSSSGSSSNSSGSSASGQPVKLTLWDIATQNDQKMIKDETDKFNKAHKDIKVDAQFFQNNPYKDKLRIALGSGNPPDIFYNWGGGPLADYVKAGDVVDLTDLLNNKFSDYKSKFPKADWGPVTVNGKIYGIPTQGSAGELLYYNKKLFKKYNLQPPTTWDNLLNAVKVLKQHGVAPIALEGKSQWPEMIWVQYLTERLGGTQVFAKIAAGDANAWSDPAVIKAMQYCQQLVDMGAFQKGYTSLDASSNQSEAMLASDKAGMLAQGSWAYNTVLTNYPDMIKNGNLGYVPFPVVDPQYGKTVVGAPSAYYSISTKTKDPQAAMTYLQEVNLNDSEVDTYINKLGLIPPVNGAGDKLKSSPNADFEVWLYNQFTNADQVQLYWDQYLSATTAKVLLDNISKVFIKQETPQQFATNMNATLGK